MDFYPGIGPSLKVAGRQFSNLGNLIVLYGATTFGKFTGLRLGTGVAYQVPTGKVLKIWAAVAQTTVNDSKFKLGYGDTNIGLNSASAPTNPIYVANDDATSNHFISVASQSQEFNTYFEVPAGKYIFFNNANASSEVYLRLYATLENV